MRVFNREREGGIKEEGEGRSCHDRSLGLGVGTSNFDGSSELDQGTLVHTLVLV